jgi:hypothetical protein
MDDENPVPPEGGYRTPPTIPKTRAQASRDHDQFIADLLTQRREDRAAGVTDGFNEIEE